MAKRQTKRKTSKRITTKKGVRHLYLFAGILAIFAFLLYTNTLGHDYALDDFSAIKDNYVTQKGVEGIPTIFTTHYRYGYWNSPGELYRPVPLALFALEWQISPDSPFIGHLMNAIWYALTGGLVFLLLAKLFRAYSLLLPLIATAIFIAHPSHVEVVANIKSRDEILAFFFGLSALYLLWKYWQNDDSKWLIFALLSYVVALFSKENAVTFVAIFPLVGYLFTKKSTKKIILSTLPFLIPVAFYLLVRRDILGDVLTAKAPSLLDNLILATENKSEQLATAFLLLGKYLKTLFLPHPLGSDFGYNQIPIVGWGNWQVLLSFILNVGLFGFGVRALLRKQKIIAFGILFYFISFSIFSNVIIKIGSSYGDRFLYPASLGFAVAISYLLLKVFKAEEKDKTTQFGILWKKNQALLMVSAGVILLFSLKTITRNMVWKNSFTLYEVDIQVAPNSAKLNYHYGLEIAKQGDKATAPQEKKERYDLAKTHLAKSIEIYPKYADAYARLGLTYYYEKNYDEAFKNYNLSIEHKPNNALVYSNLGTLYFDLKNVEKAMEMYRKAVQTDKRFVDGWRNLGSLNAMTKNFQEAIRCFQEGLKYEENDAKLNFFLGQAYKDSGNEAAGRPYLEKAYRLDPSLRK